MLHNRLNEDRDSSSTSLKGFFSEQVTLKRTDTVPLKKKRRTLSYLSFMVVFLEPCQTSTMELFGENIAEKLQHRCLTGFEICNSFNLIYLPYFV